MERALQKDHGRVTFAEHVAHTSLLGVLEAPVGKLSQHAGLSMDTLQPTP